MDLIEVILIFSLVLSMWSAYHLGKRKAEEDNYSTWKKGYEAGVKRRNLQEAFKAFDD